MAPKTFSSAILCLLGISVSLVYGQFPATRVDVFGQSGDLRDRILSFDEFGSESSGTGMNPGFFCVITAPGNSWFFPNGNNLYPTFDGTTPGSGAVLVNGVTQVDGMPNEGVFLLRGANYYDADGRWCCGSGNRAQSGSDVCVTFTPCETLPEFLNGMATYDESTNTLTYTCDMGFMLTGNNGASTRTCSGTTTSAGTWDGSDPTCAPMNGCADLGVPANADPITYMPAGSVNNRPVGSMATYSCMSGYTLSGQATRTCQSGGTFDGSAPTCMADNGAPALSGVVKVTLLLSVVVIALL